MALSGQGGTAQRKARQNLKASLTRPVRRRALEAAEDLALLGLLVHAIDGEHRLGRAVDQLGVGGEELRRGVQHIRHRLVLLQVLHHEGLVHLGLVELEVGLGGRLVALLERDDGLAGQAAAGHGQVGAFAVHRVDEAARVADDHPAVAVDLGHRVVAAFGDQVGGVLLHLAAFDQRGDAGVGLELLQQGVGAGAVRVGLEVGQQAADADRQRVLVGVEEAGADHALGDLAHQLDHHALFVLDVEALLDDFLGQEEDFLDRQGHVLGLQLGGSRPCAPACC
jgi:hypothetical protein